MRRAQFLGHDDEGRAVFWDLEYHSDAPTTRDVHTGRPSWNSPDVFRLSPAMARHHYGQNYTHRGHEAHRGNDTPTRNR
jgi:hypothetical protein